MSLTCPQWQIVDKRPTAHTSTARGSLSDTRASACRVGRLTRAREGFTVTAKAGNALRWGDFMAKIRLITVSLLVVMAVSAAASATASGEPTKECRPNGGVKA